MTSGPQDVRLTLDSGNTGPCGSPFPGSVPPPTPPPGLGLLPPLQAPPGVTVQMTGGSSGGPGRWSSDAMAVTDESPGALERLYEQELVAVGWTRVDGGSATALAWSTWSIPSQSDWQGFLYVWAGPGTSRRSLHVEVVSASASAFGPYYGYGYGSTTVTAAPENAGAVATPTPTALPDNSSSSTTAAYLKQHSLLLINKSPHPGQGGSGPMTSGIYTVHADGTGKTLLTDNGGAPSWTPDGKIIFASTRSGSQQIWIMDADGSNPRQIGQTTSNPVMPEAKNGLITFMGQSSQGSRRTGRRCLDHAERRFGP
jgi:WD40-like Beta Propeller Repeat